MQIVAKTAGVIFQTLIKKIYTELSFF